jgi:hypothetical protein
MSWTRVEGDIYVCDDCGAHAKHTPDAIIHHTTCTPGESKKWEKFYKENNERRCINDS